MFGLRVSRNSQAIAREFAVVASLGLLEGTLLGERALDRSDDLCARARAREPRPSRRRRRESESVRAAAARTLSYSRASAARSTHANLATVVRCESDASSKAKTYTSPTSRYALSLTGVTRCSAPSRTRAFTSAPWPSASRAARSAPRYSA